MHRPLKRFDLGIPALSTTDLSGGGVPVLHFHEMESGAQKIEFWSNHFGKYRIMEKVKVMKKVNSVFLKIGFTF